MIDVSTSFNEAFKGTKREELLFRVTINSVVYDKARIFNSECDYGIATDEGLFLGTTFSNSLKVVFSEVITVFSELDEVVAEMGIRLPDGSVEYCPLGKFVISERVDVNRNDMTTSIFCLDNMALMEGTYESSLTYPAPIRDVALEIANKAGMTVNTTNFSRLSTNTIKKIEGATYRQAIGMIAQLEAGYALFNRQGELEIRTLNNTEFEISPDHYRSKGLVKNDLQYRLGGISVDVDDESSLQVGSTQGSQISLENSVMTQQLLNDVYSKIENINFYPFTLEWWGNPALEVGDWVLITDLEGNEFKAPVLSYKLKFDGGISSTISADVETTSNHVTTYKPPLKQKLEKLGQSIVNNRGEITYFGLDPPAAAKEGDKWFKGVGPDEEFWIYVDGTWKEIISKAVIRKIIEDIETAMEEVEEAKRQAKLDAEKAFTDAKAHADAEVERINTALSTDIDGAIELAEQAKQEAIDEAERLVTEQDTAYQEIFEGYDSAVGDLTGSIAEADSKATNALEEAGVSSGLAQTAIDSASRAESTATTANNKAVEAFSKAEDALNSITTFEPLVSGAVNKADEAIAKADNIPATVDGIITDKGLVNGDWVNTRINDETGEINYQLESVRGDVPDVVMGIEWGKTESPSLSRTDYVEEFANLEDYILQTAEFNLSVEGLEMNLSEIERDKLDGSEFTSFKNNEYANTVNGITNRLTSVETNKLEGSVFTDFKEHDYDITVNGINGSITDLESKKLDNTEFIDFKTNEYQLTVDGFNMELTAVSGAIPNVVLGVEWGKSMSPKMERTDYVEEADLTDYYNPDYIMGVEWDMEENPTLIRTNSVQDVVDLEDYREQTAKFEFTIDGFEQSLTAFDNKKLDGEVFTTFKTNDYTNTIDGITQRLSSVETDKLDDNEFQTFKTHEYQITVDGLAGDIETLESDKLNDQEFQNFKANEYQLTMDGFDMQLTSVSGSIPNIVLGVEWNRTENPQMERSDYTEELDLTNYDAPDYVLGVEWDKKENPLMVRTHDTQESTSKGEFELFLADYSFRADGWDATNSYITENSTSINSLINNAQGWSQTISYVDENKTKFNDTVSQVDFYKQTIGSDAENLAQLVMTDEAFVTRIGQLEGMAEDIILGVEWERDSSPIMARTGYMDDWTETQVIQLADSWSMNLKSNGDVVTAINATEDGVRILGRNIILDGDTLVTGNFAVAGNHVILDADTQVRGNFRVSGSNITLDGNTTITDDFTVTGGSIILDGDTTVHDDFTVTGGNVVLDADTRIQGDFTVSGGNVILDGDTVVRGGFTVLGENIVLDANTTVLGTFKVLGGNVILDGDTTVLGDFSVFGKNIILDGDTTVLGDFTVSGEIVGSGISADNITVGKLNAANVDIINLNASSIVGLNSEFVQSAWNGINTRININAAALTASDSAGNQAIINTSGEIRSTAGGTDQTRGVFHKGRLWFHTTSGSAVLNIGAHPVVGEGVNRGSIATARAEKLVIGRYNDYLNTNPNAQVNPYITLEYGATLGDESNAFTKVWHNLSMNGKFINDVQQVSGFELAVRATSGRLMLGVTGYNTLQVGQANTRSFGNIEMQPGYEVTQASDRRWKDIVGKTETNALEEIKKLSVVDYYWKNGDGEKQFGLIAQDSPFLSVKNEDGYYGISGNKLAMLNLLSAQELYKRIEALEGEIELLKSA